MTAPCRQFSWCPIGGEHDVHVVDEALDVEIADDEGEVEQEGGLLVRTLVHSGSANPGRPHAEILLALVGVPGETRLTEVVQANLTLLQARRVRNFLDRAIANAEGAPGR